MLQLDSDPHPDGLFRACGRDDAWLGLTAMIRVEHTRRACNALTATHPQARGRVLALPLKLQAIRRAQDAGLRVVRTNTHSLNVPMLAVNRRLGFRSRPGRYELYRRPTAES